MMHEFLSRNRQALIVRCTANAGSRETRTTTGQQLHNGVPLFLDQLIRTLEAEQRPDSSEIRSVWRTAEGVSAPASEIGEAAARHGRLLLSQGLTIDQVVHCYGDLCQAITNIADECGADFQVSEFRTLNRCLDDAIAQAVTAYSRQRICSIEAEQETESNLRIGSLAHELRNSLHAATLAFAAIKAGSMGAAGATGSILERSLISMRGLIDRSLTKVRLDGDQHARVEVFSLAALIAEVWHSADLEAKSLDCKLISLPVDPRLALKADRELILSAVLNLLQNAFKFSHQGAEINLEGYAAGDRVLIDVRDRCGGLEPGAKERMFTPFQQMSANRSGVGLGLLIARRSVESSDGSLTVHDRPGIGCVFTITLPRFELDES